jgi:hypothetical protein
MPHVYLLIRARVAIQELVKVVHDDESHVLGNAVVIEVSSVYAQSPPTRSLRSNPVTLNPSSRNVLRMERPHVPGVRQRSRTPKHGGFTAPAPMTATVCICAMFAARLILNINGIVLYSSLRRRTQEDTILERYA